MTYRELCDRLDRNEHEHAREAVERIRYRMLESRLARAEAIAEQERRLRYEHTLAESDELSRLRAELARLRTENKALRQTALPDGRPDEPRNAPPAPAPRHRQPQPLRLSPAARAIMQRSPPDPAGFDRTIEEDGA
jgi:hypothetical protein